MHRLRPGRVSLVSRRRPWPRHERQPPKNAENPCPGGRGQGFSAFNARIRADLLCRYYVANSRIAESASAFATRICAACRLYLRGCQKAAGSHRPGELVMLRRVVAPAGSAQWRPCGHGTPDPPGRLGGDPQIAPVRRALRKVSTSGRRIAGARWQPECQARHREDDGVCSGDGQVPCAGRCCRIADVAGSRGMCRLDARPGISGCCADGTARRAPATLSPPAEAVTAVDIPPSHENFLIVLGAVPRSAPRCQGRQRRAGGSAVCPS